MSYSLTKNKLSFTLTNIQSFQKEKRVILLSRMFPSRIIITLHVTAHLIGYQIPLDLPPGGARILAEDLFGTLSSIWAPGAAGNKRMCGFIYFILLLILFYKIKKNNK